MFPFYIDRICSIFIATGRVIPRCRPYYLTYHVMGLLLSSILITGVGTSLVTFRILSATRGNPAIGNLAPYRRIQQTIIESGVIYLTGILIVGVPLAIIRDFAGSEAFAFPKRLTLRTSPYYAICQAMITGGQALLPPVAVGLSLQIMDFVCTHVLQGISPTLIALRVVTQTRQTESDTSQPVSRLTFRRTIRRNHTPAFGSLVSSLHFESTWRDGIIANGTFCVLDNEEVGNVEGMDGGEQIRLEEV